MNYFQGCCKHNLGFSSSHFKIYRLELKIINLRFLSYLIKIISINPYKSHQFSIYILILNKYLIINKNECYFCDIDKL